MPPKCTKRMVKGKEVVKCKGEKVDDKNYRYDRDMPWWVYGTRPAEKVTKAIGDFITKPF